MQLSAKALLKPFSSAGSIENDSETDNSDDGKLRKYELDDEGWDILRDLSSCFEGGNFICLRQTFFFFLDMLHVRCIRMRLFSFLERRHSYNCSCQSQPWTELTQCLAVLLSNHFHLPLYMPCHLHEKSWTSTIQKRTYQMSIGLLWVLFVNGVCVSSRT